MRNYRTLNVQSFICQCELHLKEYSEIFRRSSASANSKWRRTNFENRIVLKSRKLEDLVLLSLLSYYIDPEVGWLLRMEILTEVEQNSELLPIQFLCQGKGAAFCFLLDTQLWHSRDFFGNILNRKFFEVKTKEGPKDFNLFGFLMKSKRRPKRVQRHRGYRDKGTLRHIHEYHSFVNCTKEVKELEEERLVQKDTLALLQGFLE